MKFLIDDADIEAIKRIYEFYPIDGVTTNPSILAKSGKKPYEALKEIRDFIGLDAELHVQVVAGEAEGMLEDAYKIVEKLGKNTYIKIPSIPEGFKAIKALKAEKICVTATAIYTPMQAFIAGKCGADYAAPYVNRIDNMGMNGIEVAKKIHQIFLSNNFETKVLAASFKNSQQVLELCEHGIGAITASPDIIEGLVKNVAVTSAVEDFIADFEMLAGQGKTMSDSL
ncbi:fructose-6-phosphate aldolase [Alkalibacter mobilis]|uniref:fructose-6-phosphate aldolase n=1 Tax=Alkalibacter mobilis TaxID=2787712 RepID=UPI00189FEAE1|nr:fructose-6-phosphate aldolase [Alkalibacter mobilis]MBF7097764.1 fructose-6-phosphate aldolase [Alkalibacter mobilis]